MTPLDDYRDRDRRRYESDGGWVQGIIGVLLVLVILWGSSNALGNGLRGASVTEEVQPLADSNAARRALTYDCLREQSNGSLRFCTCERGKKVYRLRVNKQYKCPVTITVRP